MSPFIESFLGASAESILPCKRNLPLRRWFSFAGIGLITSHQHVIVQELRESRGGRPGLSVLTSLLVSVDVKIY